MKKGIIILSGGLDSTTLLHFLKNGGYEIYGLSFNYGQRHLKELEFAKYWGEKLCEEHKTIQLDINDIISHSALSDKSIDLPEEHYTHENQKITVVPGRNTIMLSMAIAYAENLNIKEVFYAAHFSDRSIYPDCRKEYITALSLAWQLGTYNQVEVKAPFVDMTKTNIVRLGLDLKVDYSKTWSCYSGKERPCLKCATCQERNEAFVSNTTKDPLLTEAEWEKVMKESNGEDIY